MKQNLWGYCFIYASIGIILTVVNDTCASTLSVNGSADAIRDHIALNKTGVVIKHDKCQRRHPDGSTYTGPCSEETHTLPTKLPTATDIEVKDLTESPSKIKLPTTTTEKNHQEIISPKSDPFTVDKLIEPEDRLHLNDKFNLTTGGIAAVICLTIAIAFYIGIMTWKRVIMNSYINREILLNDDDIGDINDEDMRHFELKFLDKDGRVVESANGS